MFLLAALAIALHIQSPTNEQKQLVDFLASAKLTTRPLDHGTVAYNDGEDELDVNGEYFNDKLSAVRLTARWVSDRYIPQSALDKWAKTERSRGEWSSFLDCDVLVTQIVRFEGVPMNSANLVKGITAARVERQTFKKNFPNLKAIPPGDPSPTKATIDDDMVVDGFSGADMALLARHWKIAYEPKGAMAASLSSWLAMFEIGGDHIDVRALSATFGFSPGFSMRYALTVPTGRDAEGVVKQVNALNKDLVASQSFEPTMVNVSRSFEIKKPMLLPEVKKVIEAFAKDIQPLKKL